MKTTTDLDIKEGFDDFYEDSFDLGDDWTKAVVNLHPRRWIFSLAEKEEGRGLVAGCGAVDLKIFPSARETVGVDISRVALRKVKKFGQVILADVTNLPIRSSGFDFACSVDVLEHVPNKTKMMAELARILRKEGKVFLSVPLKIHSSYGDVRQPYDDPPELIFLLLLIKKTFKLSVARGFWGRNPLNFVPYKFFPILSIFFKYFPYSLVGSKCISIVATKNG